METSPSHSSSSIEDACPNSEISKKVEGEEGAESLEKEDKKRIAIVRTRFYALNERFEVLLRFKPIRKM